MDLLSQHEAFLRAIFDAPDDDTPRLVYADFLQENSDEERAEFIRVQCAARRALHDPTVAREDVWPLLNRGVELQRHLAKTRPEAFEAFWVYERGFAVGRVEHPTMLQAGELLEPTALRERAAFVKPIMFTAAAVQVRGDRISNAAPFESLFALAVFARVTELDLSGRQETLAGRAVLPEDVDDEYVFRPTVTPAGVDALVRHRGMRRITSLDLRNNNLDNDAARALVRSPYHPFPRITFVHR